MNFLTAGSLLAQSSSSATYGPTIAIDADMELKGAELYMTHKALEDEPTRTGLTVLDSNGQVLGVISRGSFEHYLQAFLDQAPLPQTRGGSIDTLGGIPLSAVPLYRCNRHEPLYQRISWDAQPPTCKTCGHLMTRVK